RNTRCRLVASLGRVGLSPTGFHDILSTFSVSRMSRLCLAHSKFAAGIISLADGVLILALLFTMIACIVLGMGLPTTANYVVTATIAAPALINEFGLPPMAVHLFVFYFGIIADITPPVCLAAFAGAGIAQANPMKTGFTAVKLAIGAFIIPYAFIYNPVLVLVEPTLLAWISHSTSASTALRL
ncbi:TRAP transporter large permease subunit, partial [Halomonas sp. 15WGF]|uniref:TRAP transporter large permease subunit n=1 Tax=Halomonas sp. 15WGF TaxID=2570357 RepID=UPI00201E4C29